MAKEQIVWVVEQGENHEGGTVKAVVQYRTQARIIKAQLQRDRWFSHEIDYVTIRKMIVVQHPGFVRMQPWEAGYETV